MKLYQAFMRREFLRMYRELFPVRRFFMCEWWIFVVARNNQESNDPAHRTPGPEQPRKYDTMTDSRQTENAVPGGTCAAVGSPFVFLDDASRPYLAFRGWLHYWHADKKWVTLREMKPGECETLEARKLPDEQAALYGWPCVANASSATSRKTGKIMETGQALELVHGMATRLYKRHGELDPASSPAEAQDALDTVEDFIVNNFEDDAEDTPNAENQALTH